MKSKSSPFESSVEEATRSHGDSGGVRGGDDGEDSDVDWHHRCCDTVDGSSNSRRNRRRRRRLLLLHRHRRRMSCVSLGRRLRRPAKTRSIETESRRVDAVDAVGDQRERAVVRSRRRCRRRPTTPRATERSFYANV